MNDEEKKMSEQAKRLEKIRIVLAENSNNVLLDLSRFFRIFAALISSHICKF